MVNNRESIPKIKHFVLFILLNIGSLGYSELSLAMRYGLQLGTITGLAIANGSIQGTITLGDKMKGHIYYLKRSGSNMYYGMGTIIDLDDFLDSKSGILLTKGKKKKGGGGGGNGNNALEDLLLRIPVGFSTYISPALVFFELGFYVIGGKGSDSVLGIRFYF